jgi:arabinan endo-1,5-alpha-L-arabinosidase
MFYAYGTADNWGDGKGQRLVSILQSTDLVNWTWIGTFPQKPGWKARRNLGPDVVQLNGKYLLYYAYSTWGDPNPGIGVALADRPEGPFIDQGKLFDSKEIDVPNSIDPYFLQKMGRTIYSGAVLAMRARRVHMVLNWMKMGQWYPI